MAAEGAELAAAVLGGWGAGGASSGSGFGVRVSSLGNLGGAAVTFLGWAKGNPSLWSVTRRVALVVVQPSIWNSQASQIEGSAKGALGIGVSKRCSPEFQSVWRGRACRGTKY